MCQAGLSNATPADVLADSKVASRIAVTTATTVAWLLIPSPARADGGRGGVAPCSAEDSAPEATFGPRRRVGGGVRRRRFAEALRPREPEDSYRVGGRRDGHGGRGGGRKG